MDVMLKKKIKKLESEEVAEVVEEKPEILRTEVIGEPADVEITPVAKLAATVEAAGEGPDEAITEAPVGAAEPPQEPPGGEKRFSRRTGVFWPVWIALAFVLGAGAGVFLSKMDFEKKPAAKTKNENVAVVSPTVKPTEAVERRFERGVIKVKVLNGSGVKGAAAAKKAALEKLGYKEVAVGNVDGEGYKNSEISIKESLKVFEKNILQDLQADAADKKTLASDDAFDVLFIIGEK